jgi:alpha-ribazole phosphatase
MFELLLIRHGQTEWNVKRKVMGRQAIPLSATGRGQAERIAEQLAAVELSAVATSPTLRAAETAEIIASRHEGLVVEQEFAFQELDYGDWVNRDFDELQKRFADVWREYRHAPAEVAFPEGESVRDAAQRIGIAVDRLLERFHEGRVAIVSHADVLKIALIHVLKLDLNFMARIGIDNCAPLLIRWNPDAGPRLVMLNWQNFLGKEL